MWFYDNLELVVGGIFVSGVAMHFAGRWRDRRRYLRLRRAYTDAIREARDGGAEPANVVRAAELHRAFMNSWMPGWLEGFGRCVRTWLKVCAAFALLAFFLKGPIERREEDFKRRQARATPSRPPPGPTAHPTTGE